MLTFRERDPASPGHCMTSPTPDELGHLLAGADLPPDPSQEAAGEGRVGSHWQGPVRLLRGAEPVLRTASRLFQEARRELQLFLAPPMMATDEAWHAYADLRRRDVPTRELIDASFLEGDDAGSRHYLDLYREHLRANGRRHERLPGKLVVVDRRVALLSINRLPGSEHQALLVQHRGLIVHLLASFEQHWAQGRALEL